MGSFTGLLFLLHVVSFSREIRSARITKRRPRSGTRLFHALCSRTDTCPTLLALEYIIFFLRMQYVGNAESMYTQIVTSSLFFRLRASALSSKQSMQSFCQRNPLGTIYLLCKVGLRQLGTSRHSVVYPALFSSHRITLCPSSSFAMSVVMDVGTTSYHITEQK